ncbi:unnamed protein product [Rotaria socialis]|uniref:TLDc domain-containing protein n=1 Tax=Rotaria socialis TaxID=392032 RepID=A0A818P124_9BILA|nr:unnamed protein product [Rotaria socialis]CAF4647716.1 unnamed protein product [Rotaria socialis]
MATDPEPNLIISRYTDVNNEPVKKLLIPIKGYQDEPLLPLKIAVEPISHLFIDLEDYVLIALHNSQKPNDGLTVDESATIHLYTMQFQSGVSLYVILNHILRSEQRQDIKPWFPFLKLLMTALYKLPSLPATTIWRGVRDLDLQKKYETGARFAWWGVSSCTTTIDVLTSPRFLGKTGVRTMFAIHCVNGKSIVNHSYYSATEKEIILMPGSFFEVIGQIDAGSNLHIVELKEIDPPMELVKPPFQNATKSPSVSHDGAAGITTIPVSSYHSKPPRKSYASSIGHKKSANIFNEQPLFLTPTTAHISSYQAKPPSIDDPSSQTPFAQSTLLSSAQQCKLNEFYGKLNQQWELIFRGTRNGFHSEEFHRCCDNKGPTVTVIQSEDGYLFGGYTTVPWKTPEDSLFGAPKEDSTAYLFTLTNPHHIPATKFKIRNDQIAQAVLHRDDHGPCFGSGDICMRSNSNVNSESHSRFPQTYVDTTDIGKTLFTGSRYFATAEIETFRLM